MNKGTFQQMPDEIHHKDPLGTAYRPLYIKLYEELRGFGKKRSHQAYGN